MYAFYNMVPTLRSSRLATVSRWTPSLVCHIFGLIVCLNFASVVSFSFIDKRLFDGALIETNGSTNYSISCLTDDPTANTTLLFNQNTLRVGGRITLHLQTYVIHGLTLKDQGAYTCKAFRNQGGGPITKTLFLFLRKEIIPCCPSVFPLSKVLMRGQSANFTCHVNLKNALAKYLKFKWYKEEDNGFVEIPSYERYRHNDSSSVLMIRNAKATPRGSISYKCEILYKGNTSSFEGPVVTVQNLKPATINILRPARNVYVINETSRLDFLCEAEGYPPPKVSWLQNGKKLSGQHYKVYRFENEHGSKRRSILKIDSTKYPRDNGTYTCKAKNNVVSPKSVEISIQTKPILKKPSIYWGSRRIPCMVDQSSPLPTFHWQFQSGSCLQADLECEPSSEKWQNLPANLEVDPVVGIAAKKSTLSIPATFPSSFLRCTAKNLMGSDSWSLTYLENGNREVIKVTATSEEYDEGQTLQLQCIIRMNVSVISWFKDNKQLDADSDDRITVLSTKLSVKGLVANDSGLYTCLAQRSSGQNLNGSLFITIKKSYSPTILYFNNQTAYHQAMVKLFCNVSGYPLPRISWFKDNEPLGKRIKEKNGQESCEGSVNGLMYQFNDPLYVGLLVICHPSHDQHTGFYTCQASNQAGGTKATAFLNVLEDSVIVSPSEEMRKQPFRVNLGEPWNAICKATGNPAPRIEWRKKDSNDILPTRQLGSKGVVLKIDTLAVKDLGIYLCVAENSVGKDNASIELVLANPRAQGVSHSSSLKKDTVVGISFIAVAASCGLVLFIFVLVYIRYQKKDLLKYRNELFPKYSGEPQIDPDRSIFEQCSSLPYDPIWEFPEKRLTLGEPLGSGFFGQVIKAEAIGITDFNPRNKRREKVQRRSILFRRYGSSKRYLEAKLPKTTVAVKTLKANATKEEYRDLASELKILIHVGKHKNIVNLLGACTNGARLLVIMEYAPHGNLGDFLRSKRCMFEPVWRRTAAFLPELEFNISHLVNFSYQVCRGMEFLASKKCIHRDLAARNVLVGEEYVVKIADFGFARDIYSTRNYVKTRTDGVFPVKWMALESLFLGVYSEKSDVWSYGICLWEIFTLGGSPYHRIGTECLLDFLNEGNRMESPQGCPEEFYTIMKDCWREETKDRPSFAELSVQIGEIIERHASEQGYPAYISFTGDSKGEQSDYVIPVECDTSAPQHGAAAGYRRVSSGETTHSSLSSGVVENDSDPEVDEKEQMLGEEDSGNLSGNESGVDVENGNDTIAMEVRPLKWANGKRRKKRNSQQTLA